MEDPTSKKRRGRPQILTGSAKKRKRSALDAKWNRSRINIGENIDRWNEMKEESGLKTHADMAKFLLESYEKSRFSSKQATSTPFPKASVGGMPEDLEKIASGLSGISSADSCNMDSDVSGVHAMQSSDDAASEQKERKEESCSFLNPFDLTIQVSEDESESYSCFSDEDYEPSMNFTLEPIDAKVCDDVSFAETFFGEKDDQSEDEENEEQMGTSEVGPGVQRILSPEDVPALTDDHTFMVYRESLLTLAKIKVSTKCTNLNCELAVQMKEETIGSALYLKWVCKAGHHLYTWCSQPVLNRRLHSGDLLIASCILLSGNNFSKVALFAKFLKLHFVSESVFLRIQRTYLVPTIEKVWKQRQTEILDELTDDPLVLLGDGRMDSPGHCAQYCSYTMMDNTTKKIVSLVTMDKRQAGGKSTNLEKACFIKSIEELQNQDVTVSEIVTDAHMQISALMKKDYKDIKHSYDIWHSAKNLGKKIVKKGQDKSCKQLLPWTRHITNHFWHACQTANTYEEFMGVWCGVLHHVQNVHQWMFAFAEGYNHCSHGPLAEERATEWLHKDSNAYHALVDIVMNRRLQNNVPYFLNFRHTAELENFQNHILMYAAKRFSYSPPVYRARNLLAAMDYNEHVGRGPHLNKDGTVRYQRLYNKKSGRWTVTERKKEKTYPHIKPLLAEIVCSRLQDTIGMQKPVVLKPGDPRLISKTLSAIPPQPTKDLVVEKKSRMGRNNTI